MDYYYLRSLTPNNLLSLCESLQLFSTNSQSWHMRLDLTAPSDSTNGKMTESSASPLTGEERQMSRCPALEEEQGQERWPAVYSLSINLTNCQGISFTVQDTFRELQSSFFSE